MPQTNPGVFLEGVYKPPTLEQLQIWQAPILWDEGLEDEPRDVTAEKIVMAKDLGLAAIYFTPNQVDARIQTMSVLEHARLVELQRLGREQERLYVKVLNGADPFAGKLFNAMGAMRPYVHPMVGSARKSNYGVNLKAGGQKKKVQDVIASEEIKLVTEFVYIDDVAETGETIGDIDAHMVGRWTKLNRNKSPAILRRSGRYLCRKDMIQTTELGTEDNTVGFVIPEPWATLSGMDTLGRFRWNPGLALSGTQLKTNREKVEAIIELLKERVVIGINDFNWIEPKVA